MADAFIRAQNASPNHFARLVASLAPPAERGVINEAAFLLFKRSISSGSPDYFSEEAVAEAIEKAMKKNERLPRSISANFEPMSTLAPYECSSIAQNLYLHFRAEVAPVIVNPTFPGCGWVSDAEADILCGTTLYEVKAGDRQFRLSDLRQLLTYCALNFSAKSHDIIDVSLINPRSGIIIKDSLDKLCWRTAGTSAVSVMSEIVSFISEPITEA